MMTEYKADLHVHTLASPDGRSTQEELARAARERGLCALAVTDHDLCTPIDGRWQEELGVLLIPGVEISTSIGHITGLFLERPVDLEGLGKLPPPDKAVGAIHDAGGLAVLAHPYQRPGARPQDLDIPLDGIETANARADMKVREANRMAAELAGERGLLSIGGSDAHHRDEVGNAYTVIEAESPSLADLRGALEAGRCRAVLEKDTSYTAKGMSQWAKRRRAGGPKNLAIGAAYIVRCLLKDMLRRH